MTNKTYKTNSTKLILPHGGYRQLKSYQMAEIVYDFTVKFTKHYIIDLKLRSQLDGAARSGKQNIAEASVDSGTSKKIELKLTKVARGSLEELLLDCEDFLRQRDLELWGKSHSSARKIRALAYKSNKSYTTYKGFLRKPEEAANSLICLIHQTNYLLDRQLASLEKQFLKEGGFTERLYRSRRKARQS